MRSRNGSDLVLSSVGPKTMPKLLEGILFSWLSSETLLKWCIKKASVLKWTLGRRLTACFSSAMISISSSSVVSWLSDDGNDLAMCMNSGYSLYVSSGSGSCSGERLTWSFSVNDKFIVWQFKKINMMNKHGQGFRLKPSYHRKFSQILSLVGVVWTPSTGNFHEFQNISYSSYLITF